MNACPAHETQAAWREVVVKRRGQLLRLRPPASEEEEWVRLPGTRRLPPRLCGHHL